MFLEHRKQQQLQYFSRRLSEDYFVNEYLFCYDFLDNFKSLAPGRVLREK